MIYVVCGAIVLYELFGLLALFLMRKAQEHPSGVLRPFEIWAHGANLFFVVTMLAATLPYSPKRRLFRWRMGDGTTVTGTFVSAIWGLVGGLAALALAIPFLWLGDKQLRPISLLLMDTLSPIGLLKLAFFVLALAISSEIVFRGIVFRTLKGYASAPAAVFASCLIFATVCPVFSYPNAIILGVVSAILFQRFRNLLAPITANVLFMLGGSAIMLYRGLMHA